MADNKSIIEIYDFDDDKKQSLTQATLSKMLRELKDALRKHGKIRIIIEKA